MSDPTTPTHPTLSLTDPALLDDQVDNVHHHQTTSLPSPALNALRRSASEVNVEDSLEGGEALIKAAEEIALERNLLMSPQSKHRESPDNSPGGRGSPFPALRNSGDYSPAKPEPKTVRILESENTTANSNSWQQAVPQSNNITSNPHRSESPILKTRGGRGDSEVDADLAALMALTKNAPKSKPAPTREQNDTSATDAEAARRQRERAAYLVKSRQLTANRRQDEEEEEKSVGRASTRSTSTGISALSRRLAESSEQPWGARLQNSFQSSMQETLLLSMKRVGKGPSTGKDGRKGKAGRKSEELRKIADRLGRPVSAPHSAKEIRADPTLKYLLFEEAVECTFRPPQPKGGKKLMEGEAKRDKEEGGGRFYDRLFDKERIRLEELAFREGEAKYEALVDKKYCPRCGAKQKFDEVKNKKTKCPVCQEEYRKKITWGQVSRDFFSKEKEYTAKKEESMKRLAAEIEKEEEQAEVKKFDRATGKIVVVEKGEKQRWDKETKKEFFDRQESSLQKKEEFIKTLDYNLYKDIGVLPKITSANEEEEADHVAAFLARVDADLQDRRERAPWCFNQKKQPDPLLASRPPYKPI